MSGGVSRVATRLAVALAGASFAVGGLVLLLRAGWLAIALSLGPIWASVIVGASLLAIGALMAVLALRRRRPPAPSNREIFAMAATAFFEGLAAGRAVRKRK